MRAYDWVMFRAAAGTRVPDVLNISEIFNRIYGMRISIYRILTQHQ